MANINNGKGSVLKYERRLTSPANLFEVPGVRNVYSPLALQQEDESRPVSRARSPSLVAPKPEDHAMFAPNLRHQVKLVDKRTSAVGNCVKDFEIVRELGKGSYGQVFLVKSLLEQKAMAAKMQQTGGSNMQSTGLSTSEILPSMPSNR